MKYLGHTYTKKLFIIFLKFKLHWETCILFGNPMIADIYEFSGKILYLQQVEQFVQRMLTYKSPKLRSKGCVY